MARRIWKTAAALATLTVTTPAVLAQSDPLDRIRALRQIADQKADANVREALLDADKIAKASPAEAARRLKQLIVSLDVSAEISSEKRKDLIQQLQNKIAVLEGRAAPTATTPAVDPKITARKEEARKVPEAFLIEAKEVREGVQAIERFHAVNKTAEAHARVMELAKKYPNNPAVLILVGQGTFGDRVAVANELAREQSDRFVLAMNGVQSSALPAKGDIEFDKDYAARMKRRDALQPKLLAPEEEAILKSLEQIVKTGVKEAPFEETLQTLSNLIDKPIYLDKKSLDEQGVDLRRPVSIPANVTARTALRGALQSLGLTFIIKDKVIQVVTLEKARESLVTRSYYLGDVISLAGPFNGAVTWGPFIDYQQTTANAQVIVDSVTKSIDPMIWKERGGPATVSFHYPSMSLIVRAPAEVHASLNATFNRR